MMSPSPVSPELFRRELLAWFARNARNLPWRRRRTPYRVWVSEIMLQQTQVKTVVPYYLRWMKKFPTIRALARAPEAQVLALWQGLGYYSRARNLLRAARVVVERHAGRFPDSEAAVRALPGVGRYTAGAIRSIAFNVPTPVLDGNVRRVLARVYAVREAGLRGPVVSRFWSLAQALVPADAPGRFNEALMELGALVCVPSGPDCGKCPLSGLCRARLLGLTGVIPAAAPRPGVKNVATVAALVRLGDRVLLRCRKPGERMAGLWEFPETPVDEAAGQAPQLRRFVETLMKAPAHAAPKPWMELRYTVTRYRVKLAVFDCPAPRRPFPPPEGTEWVPVGELPSRAMPSAHRRIARALATRG